MTSHIIQIHNICTKILQNCNNFINEKYDEERVLQIMNEILMNS